MAAALGHVPNLRDYAEAVAQFRWQIPGSFNFATDVVDVWARDQDKLALLWCNESGSERRFSFADVRDQSMRLARALTGRGLAKGARVIVMLPRIPQWHIAMLACLRMGAIPIPCIDMLTAKDVAYRAAHSGAIGAITTKKNSGKFAGLDSLAVKLAVDGAPGWDDFDAALARHEPEFPAVRIDSEDPVAMYYTSGSTGNPKGVTHAARALFAWRHSSLTWQDLGPDDLMWCTADTGWSKAGTSILFGPWSCGAAVLFYDGRFDARERLAVIAKFRVTVFCAAATEFRRIVDEDPANFELPSLRLTVSAGETVNPEIVRRWQAISGVPLLDGYGQTETLMTVLNYRRLALRPGSMGKPMPGVEVAVLDGDNRPLGSGATGQLAVRLPNPQFMLGYWNEPERTAAGKALVEGVEYWLTGDVVRVDADGYLFYEGRADDIISSAGYRIGPMEVENALLEHPAVQECAAVAKADPQRGEIVKAFIVLKAGKPPTDELARELQEHVKSVTAPYKYPREIEFVADLPKNASGKLLRRELRERCRST